MAQPRVGGLRTTGSRDVAEAGVVTDLSPQPVDTLFRHVFQSRKTDFVISLKKRRIHFLADGSREEEVPTSEAGNRLDMVRFTDNFFRTNDDEIAKAFEAQPSHIFGIEGLCWRAEDLQRQHRTARAAEIRAALASDPALAKEVALAPSDKKDWDVGDQTRKPKAQSSVEEMTPEELEAATAPVPGSRTR